MDNSDVAQAIHYMGSFFVSKKMKMNLKHNTSPADFLINRGKC